MKKYFLFALFLKISIAVAIGQSEVTLRIDPDNARGGTASQLFSSIKYIPLETTKESLFGSIDQLEVTDSFFVILDMRSRSILIFNRDGSFHKRIKTQGLDKLFGYFTINLDSNQIETTNNFNDHLLVYNFDGKLIKTLPFPENARALFDFDNGNTVYNLRRISDGSKNRLHPFDLCYSTKDGVIKKYLHPYNPRNQGEDYNIMDNPINFSGEPGSCLFSLPFDNHIFQLKDTGIVKDYNFVFPLQYSLPVHFATDSNYKGKRPQYVYYNPDNAKKINSINSVYKIGNYLFFSASNGVLRLDADRNFMYNLKNGDLISFNRVTADSSSYYFPILAASIDKVNAVHNNLVFTSIPSFRILSISRNLAKNVNYPPALNELIKTGSKTNNPVIVQLKVKPNL